MPRKHVPWAKRDAANDVVERSSVGLRRYEMEMWLLQNPWGSQRGTDTVLPFLARKLGFLIASAPPVRRTAR
jgi:hypothetical protein